MTKRQGMLVGACAQDNHVFNQPLIDDVRANLHGFSRALSMRVFFEDLSREAKCPRK
jgi:hypothetical protein